MPAIVTMLSRVVVTDIILDPCSTSTILRARGGIIRSTQLRYSRVAFAFHHHQLHFVCQQDCLRYFSHRFAIVHTGLLYLAESLLLAEALFLHQYPLGTFDNLACLELFGEGTSFFFEEAKLVVTSQANLNGGRNPAFAEGFGELISKIRLL